MGDKKRVRYDGLCSFAPDGEKAGQGDAIPYRRAGTLSELNARSDRCLKYVSERLDQIEEEILAGADNETK